MAFRIFKKHVNIEKLCNGEVAIKTLIKLAKIAKGCPNS
jgi:hypothetical protein